jgi:hypothetical protein
LLGIKSSKMIHNQDPKKYSYSYIEIEAIAFNGFQCSIPQETLDIISTIAVKVGSPAYIKTPVFQRREQSVKSTAIEPPIRRRRAKEIILGNTDWDVYQQPELQPTLSVLVQKEGIDAKINQIRVCLNKLSELTYDDNLLQIKTILSMCTDATNDEMYKVGNAIFEIASNNKFFSKLYANIYTDLMKTFHQLTDIFDKNYESYLLLFKNIDYIDPDVDYNQFCINNVFNEKRKAVSAFFVNLSLNGVIPPQHIMNVLKELFESVLTLMVQPNKTNEVCELIENIAILYNEQVMKLTDNLETTINHDGVEKTFTQVITQLSTTRMKTYPSLSSKSIFKCMDL